MFRRTTLLALAAVSALTTVSVASFATPNEDEPWGIVTPTSRTRFVEHTRVVEKVAGMTSDADLSRRVARRGLSVVNVAWEDTARNANSALGPNISDVTLQVRMRDRGEFRTALMPVIRFPNFTDRTGDIPADRFFVRVGNETGDPLRTVPLTDVLRNIKAFSADPDSIGGNGNLLAPRDTHFLVSAQAVFLPVPREGKAEFNPAVFNYQSSPGSPAVLTMLVTRQGTSIKVIENRPEERTPLARGQELYFNDGGSRAALTAERRSDVVARIEEAGGPRNEDERSAVSRGADVLFLVQVPLRTVQRRRPMSPLALGGTGAEGAISAAPAPAAGAMPRRGAAARERSDVEQAVLGHGPRLGPYAEGGGTTLVRDTRFPVRITVQFYKATSNGVVSDADLDGIARSIGGVYEHASFVGSLVVPDGDPRRPTAWRNVPSQWFPW
jgi:hypothetical protein